MSAIPFREDDFVKKLDRRVGRACRLSFVNEFVKPLGLPEHVHVFAVAMGHAAKELVHVEVVDKPLFLAFARSRVHILAICVEQRCEAAHECSADLICSEGDRADDTDSGCAPSVD